MILRNKFYNKFGFHISKNSESDWYSAISSGIKEAVRYPRHKNPSFPTLKVAPILMPFFTKEHNALIAAIYPSLCFKELFE